MRTGGIAAAGGVLPWAGGCERCGLRRAPLLQEGGGEAVVAVWYFFAAWVVPALHDVLQAVVSGGWGGRAGWHAAAHPDRGLVARVLATVL